MKILCDKKAGDESARYHMMDKTLEAARRDCFNDVGIHCSATMTLGVSNAVCCMHHNQTHGYSADSRRISPSYIIVPKHAVCSS